MTIDKETRQFKFAPIFIYKSLWDFSKKKECNLILQEWQMTFQVSDYKGNHFLDLLNNDYLLTKLTYLKDSLWLKLINHFNSLCTRVTRAITNHISIGEYCLFPKKNFSCQCRVYPIKLRQHILYKCRRYNNYWSSNSNSLLHFVTSLKFNPEVFFFYEGVI